MSAPLAFRGELSNSESQIHVVRRGFPGEYDEKARGGRRWAPRTTLLLAAGVSSVFWIALAWLIAVNL